jgi:MinD-like ATPase involved in chromosome partitioning or flagellar assembly
VDSSVSSAISEQPQNLGQVVTVWSAAGSPGRSCLVAAFACELAKTGKRILVIDADVHAPSLIQVFGFDQNYSGLSAAIRMQLQGTLDSEAFEQLLLDFEMPRHRLKLLAGLTMVNRWPEIGFENLRDLLNFARGLFDFVLVDVGSSLETSLVDSRMMSERNSATLAALSVADHVVAVTTADVIGLNRFIWASGQLRELKLEGKLHIIVNRLNQDVLGKKASGEVAQTIRQFVEHEVAIFIEEDAGLFARALRDGVPINLVGKNSSVKQAVAQFVLSNLLNSPSKSRRRVAKLG